MRTILAFLRKDFLIEKSYRLQYVFRFFSVLVIVISYYFLSRLIDIQTPKAISKYSSSYFAFVIIGMSVNQFLQFSLESFKFQFRQMQLNGTLEMLLLTPISLFHILIGSSLYSFIASGVRFLFYMIFVVFFLHDELVHSHWFAAFTVFILTMIVFVGLGIISTAFTMLLKKGDPISFLINYAHYLFAGVLYPVDVLPAWIQKWSMFLPLTHSLTAIRLALFKQAEWYDIFPFIETLLMFIVIIYPISFVVFLWSVKLSKEYGTVSHY